MVRQHTMITDTMQAEISLQVDLNFNLVERKTGGISGGGGISATGHSEGALPGIVGSAAYSQRNLFGLNQKLNASVEIGQVTPSPLFSTK